MKREKKPMIKSDFQLKTGFDLIEERLIFPPEYQINYIQNQRSIFETKDTLWCGACLTLYSNGKERASVEYYNIGKHNLLYYKGIGCTLARLRAYWKQDLPKGLDAKEFCKDAITLVESCNTVQSRLFYLKYQNYISEDAFIQMASNDVLAEAALRDFYYVCQKAELKHMNKERNLEERPITKLVNNMYYESSKDETTTYISKFVDGFYLGILFNIKREKMLKFVSTQNSIFKEIDTRYCGYSYTKFNDLSTQNFTYYNLGEYNIILWNENVVACWKQDIKIPLSHEFLKELSEDILDSIENNSCLKERIYYLKYKDMLSENMWMYLGSDDISTKEFEVYCRNGVNIKG